MTTTTNSATVTLPTATQILITADGPDFSGEYSELVPDRRMVSTRVYAPLPEFVAVNTLTLEERDGATLLTVLVQHATQEARDGHLNAGMEGGMQEALDALEQVTASLGG